MASLQSAAFIIRQLEDVVEQNTDSKNLEATRREALRLSRLLISTLEKPEELAFETGLLVRQPIELICLS